MCLFGFIIYLHSQGDITAASFVADTPRVGRAEKSAPSTMRTELLALIVCSASALQLPTAAALGRRAAISSAAAAVSLAVPQLANAATPEKLYCLNVVLRVKAARREEFLKCIASNQLGTMLC